MVWTAKPATQTVSAQALANLALLYGGPRRGASDRNLAAFDDDHDQQVLIPGLPTDEEFWYRDFPIATPAALGDGPATRPSPGPLDVRSLVLAV